MDCRYKKEWTEQLYNGNKNILYIDIPFCQKICEFCIFNSAVVKSEDVIQKYVDEVLIPGLEECSATLGDVVPEEVFFGGGTPSLLTIEQLEEICKRVPHFQKIKVKAFEAHPESMSIDKLRRLIHLGFNYFTFGVQTLDLDILKKINRASCDIDKLKQIVSMIKTAGGIVSLDLIAYLREWDINEITYTISDLNIITKEIKPDIVVIHSNYKKYKPTLPELKAVNDAVRNVVQYTEYYVRDESVFDSVTNLIMLGAYSYNIYRGNFNIIKRLKNYNCSGPGQLDSTQNVYAVGGIKERKIYSYIGGYKQWYQFFDPKTKEMCMEEVPFNTYFQP